MPIAVLEKEKLFVDCVNLDVILALDFMECCLLWTDIVHHILQCNEMSSSMLWT